MSESTKPTRDREALSRHYGIERELADRLRTAPPEQRVSLYRTVYDELFLRVPDHPQSTRKQDASQQRDAAEWQLKILQHFLRPDTVYLEIGAGDCYLAGKVARQVRHVYAVEVSGVVAKGDPPPANFTLVLSDGIAIDVPEGSAQVAYSHQVMEHLHPEDAFRQLSEICRALSPAGVYICITPHRFSGPHDISKYFDIEATGFHLKEYTYSELRALFRRAGFSSTRAWMGLKGHFFPVPEIAVLAVEAVLRALPRKLRKGLATSFPLRSVFGSMILVGRKSA